MARTTKIHRRIYEDFYNVRLTTDVDIHHIDGNHFNNEIENLKLVTLQEHFDIHYSQGDYAAAFRIAQRMNVSKEEKSKLASLAATKANKEGKCGFKLGHASSAGKLGGKKGGLYAKQNRTGIFALSPEKNKERHFNSVVTKLINNGKACKWPRENI
jgi:HNH endonuclease